MKRRLMMDGFIASRRCKGLVQFTFGVLLGLTMMSRAGADSLAINFESFTVGTVNGQDGWSSLGAAGSGCALYDHALVNNTYGYASFGTKSLRISNAVVSGCFSDQTFSKSLTDEAGESSAISNGYSGGTRKNHFEAQFQIASTVPGSQQSGLYMSVSPDRGDGARMSYLRFEDLADGIHVFFDDYQDGAVEPAGTCTTGDNFIENDIATLNRSVPHTIKFVMDFVDGAGNDVVKIYVDGILKWIGTSWEDYFRYCESNPTRPVDSLLFRTGGTVGTPSVLGSGFLIDNLSLSSSPAVLIGTCSFQDNSSTKVRTLLGDCITDETITVPHQWTLDGNGHQITAVDPVGGNFLGAIIKNAGARLFDEFLHRLHLHPFRIPHDDVLGAVAAAHHGVDVVFGNVDSERVISSGGFGIAL